MKKLTFALFFGNRGFMPAELIEGAREDMVKAVTDSGYDYIIMDKDATRYGAVETRDEGRIYAEWLKSHKGEYDGIILFSIFCILCITFLQKSIISSICGRSSAAFTDAQWTIAEGCRRD